MTFWAVAGQPALAAPDRPATEEEMGLYCSGDEFIKFGIIGVDTSREKPFDFISCPFRVVREADCEKLSKILDINPESKSLREQLAPAHMDYCIHMF